MLSRVWGRVGVIFVEIMWRGQETGHSVIQLSTKVTATLWGRLTGQIVPGTA